MEWIVILVLSGWYVVTIHKVHKHHNTRKFKIVATLIPLEDGHMKINFTGPAVAAPIVKQTVTFTGSEPNPVSVDLLPVASGVAGATAELAGTYTGGQQLAATLTQTDSLGTVSPATPFDLTLVADAVAAPDASGIVATLVP
jgi:hypothetical protein